MPRRWILFLTAFLFASIAHGEGAGQVELKVGDEVPGFSLVGSDGRTHSLADHLGKRVVVLAWFPKAFTSG